MAGPTLTTINRELGVVQTRLDGMKEQTAAADSQRRREAEARAHDVKKCIGRMSDMLETHITREEKMESRVAKLEADNNRTKGANRVLVFFAAAVSAVATAVVSKALAAQSAITKLFQ